MDDDEYTPRSPDLSALNSYTTGAQMQQQLSYSPTYTFPPNQESFSLPRASPYYQPPQLLQEASSYNQTQYLAPSPYDSVPPRIKTDDAGLNLSPQKSNILPSSPQAAAVTASGKVRKMSTKQQQQKLALHQPRLPAPGDHEKITIKTKFPVARIKRLVQADDEVGKVAQVTPPVVGKALELFMIQITLAAIAEAQARGSKRLTATHIKAAISADDKFDFLKEIGDRIPEGAASKSEGRERKPKLEKATSEDDVDMDGEKLPPKRRSGGKRKKVADDE